MNNKFDMLMGESDSCCVSGNNSSPDFAKCLDLVRKKVGSMWWMWPLDSSPCLYRHSCHQT